MRLLIHITLLVLFIAFSAFLFDTIQLASNEQLHKIRINHPGKDKENAKTYDLIEVQGPDGLPIEYYMYVQSVYCYEKVCKVDPVKMYWNNIGVFLRYELSSEVKLEKNKGEFFTHQDYQKLQTILKDTDSPFKGLRIEEITASYLSHEDESIDAISGATVIEFDDEATVQGSSLTCYTLWHWAHGDIQHEIQKISDAALSTHQLINLLEKEDEDYKIFTIQYLTQRKAYEVNTLKRLSTYTPSASQKWLNLFVKYIEGAPSNIYFKMMDTMISTGDSKERIAYLTSLRNKKQIAPKGYFQEISNILPQLESYQEVDLLLNILSEKMAINELAIKNVLLLLNKDIFIARRAYYFLIDQPLNKDDKKQVIKFYKKNIDYL